mgnify:FL=1
MFHSARCMSVVYREVVIPVPLAIPTLQPYSARSACDTDLSLVLYLSLCVAVLCSYS